MSASTLAIQDTALSSPVSSVLSSPTTSSNFSSLASLAQSGQVVHRPILMVDFLFLSGLVCHSREAQNAIRAKVLTYNDGSGPVTVSPSKVYNVKVGDKIAFGPRGIHRQIVVTAASIKKVNALRKA